MPDVKILRELPARTRSILTNDEWTEVRLALERGVRAKEIFEAFAQYRGYTYKGFIQAVKYRERMYWNIDRDRRYTTNRTNA